jgi:hypothetical protein
VDAPETKYAKTVDGVHGSVAPMEWLKLTIDPSANYPNGPTCFGPFSWERQTQTLP